VELLVVIGIIALLAAILLPVLAQATHSARSARCKSRQRQYYQALRLYLSNFDEFFPVAFHRSGSQADLSDLTFFRFIVQEACQTNFTHVVNPASSETLDDKLSRNKKFWQCPATGWTNDYFVPMVIFRGHKDGTGTALDFTNSAEYDKQAQLSELDITGVPSTERPVLTEVNASLADSEAEDPDDAAHESEMQSGWCTVDIDGNTVFVGAGQSLRTVADYDTTRFDFRHNKRANFLFLDGHVIDISETNGALLRRVHDRWDKLVVKTTP